MAIMRIHDVKSGPFHEHSSQLYSIAAGVPNWSKVNSGLFKMYEAEVLGKRVVVQHIPLGGLLEWKNKTHGQFAASATSSSSASSLAGHPTMQTHTIPPWEALRSSMQASNMQFAAAHPSSMQSSNMGTTHFGASRPSVDTSMPPPLLPPITRRPKRTTRPSTETKETS
ncbi:hypothetical protein CVT24_007077 [Panaeolus cyanescens]|uniref:Serine/threonine-protein phosphatase 2A activator n=1 Tax=Panaeolus cyanescens TaxID=181874 RepID=A0A409YP00_9AGAR|nr:hypothetical protein CVT24_007077 [Panaeolus cyanescens]